MSSSTVKILEADVAFYAKLASRDQERFVEKVERFVSTKAIRWAGGSVVVDERVRVLVAAPACRLSLNLVAEDYRRLQNIDVFSTTIDYSPERHQRYQGLAFGAFSIWLALDALETGLRHAHDGENVGYHEFAHVLDASDGVVNGLPPLLLDPTLRSRWTQVLRDDLARLRAVYASGREALLPSPACENEAELFAYATEAFFERPRALREWGPDLFGLLSSFYCQDPLLGHAGV